MKYEHAVAATQKSTSGHTDAPEVDINEEDDEDKGSDGTNKRRRQKSSLSAAEEEQKAAGLMEAVLKAHRKLQQLQASCCFCCSQPDPLMLQDSIPYLM